MGKTLNKVAVIVPVYNAKKTIKACVKSLQTQTLKDILIVLVDDGSRDGSSDLCDEFAAKDSRIIVIHQENKGAQAARITGWLSSPAQSCKYLMTCDADDRMPKDAIEKLYEAAESNGADCACGDMASMWKFITFKNENWRECFKISSPKVYNHGEIINELYVSCFGCQNFPVSLWAKIYKTDFLTKSLDYISPVKFKSDDLALTIRIMPVSEKLVVIPDVVYYYRIGGTTSRFMPYLLDDWLAIYKVKCEMSQRYKMPQDIDTLMNAELMNYVNSYLLMCKKSGHFTDSAFMDEIKRVCEIKEVIAGAKFLSNKPDKNFTAENICNKNYDAINSVISERANARSFKQMIKSILLKL